MGGKITMKFENGKDLAGTMSESLNCTAVNQMIADVVNDMSKEHEQIRLRFTNMCMSWLIWTINNDEKSFGLVNQTSLQRINGFCLFINEKGRNNG